MLVRMSQGAQAECVADAAEPVRSWLQYDLFPLGSLQEQVEPGAEAVTSDPVRSPDARRDAFAACASPFRCGVPLIRGIAREVDLHNIRAREDADGCRLRFASQDRRAAGGGRQ